MATGYFNHDSNARNTSKILRLRKHLGAAGYGVYIMLLERLYSEDDYMSVRDYEILAYDLQVEEDLIRSVVEDFALFVFSEDGAYFWSDKFGAAMDVRSIRSEAGKKGAEKRWGENPSTMAQNGKTMANEICHDSKTMANEICHDSKTMANDFAMIAKDFAIFKEEKESNTKKEEELNKKESITKVIDKKETAEPLIPEDSTPPIAEPEKEVPPNPPKKKPKPKLQYAEHVRMTIEEYAKLVNEFGEALTQKFIEKLNNYKLASGRAYKSDYGAMHSWVINQVLKDNNNGTYANSGTGAQKPAQPTERNYEESMW